MFERLLAAMAAVITLGAGAATAQAGDLKINVLSTRADLVSGGDALASVTRPAKVALNGRDITGSFATRPDGRFEGVVTGLRNGSNTLTARLADGTSTSATVINHPIGGPIFTGPQVQPWVCQAGAKDKQCNQPATFAYQYKSSVTGQFRAYDPASPPPDVGTTTTENGQTVPYIVRVETGYLDRDQYAIATLWQPGKPWAPWAPQPQWNHKLLVTHGASCGADHTTSTAPSVMNDTALSRGMAVMATAMDNAGHDCSVLTEAESLVMAKEHLIDSYGTLRYTIGTGCSGGSLVQHQVANAYPGIYQGIIPQCSFPDSWSTGQQLMDYQLTRNYFENPAGWGAGIVWSPVQIAAVQGHPTYANSVELSTLYWPSLADPTYACAGVTAEQRYNPQSNPGGVRCSMQDYMINLFGPAEGKNPHGFAGHPLDNVGVQYGLQALRDGLISTEQFLDINRKIGGFDIDANKTPGRTVAAQPALPNAYRGGAINEANNLVATAVIDLRAPDPGAFHDAYRAWTVRARLERADGHFPRNHVIWFGGSGEPEAIVAMDRWLSKVEADHRPLSLERKVALDRPDDVQDRCSGVSGAEQVNVPGVGQVCKNPLAQTRFGTPRTVAGESITTDTEKCRLRPLRAADYYPATFTDAEWADLNHNYPGGVCDYSVPGVGQQPTIPWQTYQQRDGDVVYGGRPLGPAPAGSGGGWSSASFDTWLGR